MHRRYPVLAVLAIMAGWAWGSAAPADAHPPDIREAEGSEAAGHKQPATLESHFGDLPLFTPGDLGVRTPGVTPVGKSNVVRAGLEARICTLYRWLTSCADLDVGGPRDRVSHELHMAGYATGVVAVPRAVLFIGQRVRMRLAVETPFYKTLTTSEVGLAVALGVLYAF